MNNSTKILVPNGRDIVKLLGLSSTVQSLSDCNSAEFSFEDVDFVTPGWLLLVTRILRDFRSNRPGTRCRVINTASDAMAYAGNAGFFKSLGVKRDDDRPAPNTSPTFLPITTRYVQDIHRSRSRFQAVGEVIQDDAEKLSSILSQDHEGLLYETLSYSIREIIRNVVEHSNAEEFLISAQSWLTVGTAEIAISDAGIGIANGLRSHGKYSPEDDAEALTMAVQPGVSGAIIPKRSDDPWVNSGYGLYLAKGLADGSRGFILASGSAALTAGDSDQEIVQGTISGTCVVLRLRAGSVPLRERLSELTSKRPEEPSPASLKAKINKR